MSPISSQLDILGLLGRCHPIIVHLPISLLWLAFVFEIISFKQKNDPLRLAISYTMYISAISALISIGLGFILINQDEYSSNTSKIHLWLGVFTGLMASISALAHFFEEKKSFQLTLLISVISVSLTGHYGALITHGENYLSLKPEIPQVVKNDSAETDSENEKKSIKIISKEDQLSIDAIKIINRYCIDCHGSKKIKGKLRLDTPFYTLKGGENGPVIEIGHPEKSELIRRVLLPADDEDAMPTKGKRLNKHEISILKSWIKMGAKWPNVNNTLNIKSSSNQIVNFENNPRIQNNTDLSENQISTSTVPNNKLSDSQIAELNIKVRTILAHNCYSCHDAQKSKGGLRLDKKEFIFKGGKNGPILIAGQPENSELIRRIKLPADDEDAMPTKGKRIPKEEIELLSFWIKSGAPWPSGPEKSLYRVADMAPRLPEIPQNQTKFKNPIDYFVNQYFQKNKIQWKNDVDDQIFLRRIYLDIIGLLPTPQQKTEFIQDKNPNKRTILAKKLLDNNSAYTQHWLSFWNDLLRNDYSGTGYITNGRFGITKWLYQSLKSNKSYNQVVKELINPKTESQGFIKGIAWRGTINSSQSTEMQAAQNVSQVFFGLNLKCASCHDSFINDWKLEDAYNFANIFAENNLEIHHCDVPTGKMATRKVLYHKELGELKESPITSERLVQLSNIIVQKKNGRLYRTFVNRIWAQLMGRGIVEPVDAMDNAPWSQDLLDWLAYQFSENDGDIKKLIYQIVTSKIYQQPSFGIKEAQMLTSSNFIFKGMLKRRLTAEQFSDAVSQTFSPLYLEKNLEVKNLPDQIKNEIPFVRASLVRNDVFLTSLGRPNRETVSTSRTSQANLLQALELTNGSKYNQTLQTGAKKWIASYQNSSSLIQDLYVAILGRKPNSRELRTALNFMGNKPKVDGIQDLVWVIQLLPEFQLII
ncbi:MAG: DUF1549 domain-containing protein [Aquirufa sp.]